VDETTDVATVIGAPAARFVSPGPRLDRARERDLAQWAVGTQVLRGDLDGFAFLVPYVAAAPPGLDAETLRARCVPRAARIWEKKGRRLASRPRREPHGPPPPVPLPDEGLPPSRRIRPLEALGAMSRAGKPTE
ncbi:MAG: hypothetical protein ACC662_09440, partial [Planctomycetota bacterium]